MSEVESIHKPFRAWLDARQIPYRYDRTDKRTRTTRGEPDLLITWMGRCLHIEAKIPPNKLSPEQEKRIAYLRKAGNRVEVCRSLADCIEATKSILKEPTGIYWDSRGFAHHARLDVVGSIGCKASIETLTPRLPEGEE